MPVAATRPEPRVNPAAHSKPAPSGRLLFVDNIRVFLTILVILHHLMITYAGTGGWLYEEGEPDMITSALGGWFCAVNQSYFMSLFLLISAYFVPGSYDRKGAGLFLKDRLIRLGIPLAVYSWILNPVFVYFLFREKIGTSFWQFFPAGYFKGGELIGQGPLWFVEVLLIFSLLYVLWRVLTRRNAATPEAERSFPASGQIILLASGIAVLTFLVRLAMPMDGYTFRPLNLQLPFFVPYIALFIVGLVAFRRNWLVDLPEKTGRAWLFTALGLILVWAPLMLLGGGADNPLPFKGGLHWQAAVYALWESFMAVAMSIAVIYVFRRFFNTRGRVAAFLIPNAYAAYLIHAFVIVGIALVVRNVHIYPLLKWVLVAPVAVAATFGLAALVRKLPLTDRVL